MVGWPWRSAGNGVVGQPREEGGQPDDMDSRNAATTLPHVEKDVLAAGRTACYKVCVPSIGPLHFGRISSHREFRHVDPHLGLMCERASSN